MARNFPKKSVKNGWRALVETHSPYLASLLPGYADDPADAAFEKLLRLPAKAFDTQGLMHFLRAQKKKAAIIAGAADLKGEWDDLKAMRQLSRFADFCVTACLRHLLLKAHAEKKIRLKDPENPEKGCGVVVIALGKWGAFELNYSSDIDLMVVFDRNRAPVADKDEAQNFFTRLTREMARMLDQPDDNGYVFRTDLRLRPDPGAMPLAVSIDAAETYYGSLGQNWERAAMIKARAVTGDAALAKDFARIMTAWIWRRNLDFAAIQDINSIKRQINAKHAHKEKAGNPFLGFNVKLGHGGIREIEFFAQTQQLIYGGRAPDLRCPDTLPALAALRDAGRIEPGVCADLTAAYLFLRRVEHRLQMQEDRQTHTLPDKEDAFAGVAAFMEYKNAAAFLADLARHTGCVRKLYAGLFTESPSLSGPGNLVFTGVEDDPETLETLEKMGFGEPSRVAASVRGWHHGRYRAVRGERARQILTELIPHLLVTIGKTAYPDEAFLRFDAFLSRLPSGVPVFSMFMRNPAMMALVADIMGTSPAMAEYLGSHPEVLDGVLSRDYFGALPDLAALKKEMGEALAGARDYQDVLDIARRFAREKRFHAGLHILKGVSPDAACGACFADIAEAVLHHLVPAVEKEFAKAHGVFKKGEFALLSMGSLAARRMFADSDLDLVGIYRVTGRAEQSDGPKPLPPNVYYIRLMQRLIAALTAPTAEGVLYDVDTRLRPHGEKGPLAASFEGFSTYQKNEAWVWEHMSLIRARTVYGPKILRADIEAARLDALCAPRDAGKVRRDILDMRAKVEKQFGAKDPWRLRHVRGGIMDIMFAAHYLALTGGKKACFSPDVQGCLAALKKEKFLSKKDFDTLAGAHDTLYAAMSFLYLCAEMPFNPDTAPEGVKKALAAHVGGEKETFKALSRDIAQKCADSFAAFGRVMGEKNPIDPPRRRPGSGLAR